MNDDAQAAFKRVIARAWADPEFKKRLLSDAKAALAEMGIEPPEELENVTLKVVEDTADTVHLVLPAAPETRELTDDALDRMSGGVGPSRVHNDTFGFGNNLWDRVHSDIFEPPR